MLVDLTCRSNEPELMDDPEVNKKDLAVALKDIGTVNKWLGGNSITINAVINRVKTNISKEWVIVDLGCGDGQILRQLADELRKKNIKVRLIGIDINPKCLNQAKQLSIAYSKIHFYSKDVLKLTKDDFFCDIIICTLTLHHFNNDEIKKILNKSLELVTDTIIINDLHRTRLSYYLFKIFSFFFIKGYIAKNDGLVSIKRGFKRKELLGFSRELQLKSYKLNWKWAFRYCWIISC